jgi:small GTP-binding protein
MTHVYYQGTNGIILVFAFDDRHSFEGVERWYEQIKSNGDAGLRIVLVGNKCDLHDDKRQVSAEAARELAKKLGVTYFETSALQDINIKEVFEVTVPGYWSYDEPR